MALATLGDTTTKPGYIGALLADGTSVGWVPTVSNDLVKKTEAVEWNAAATEAALPTTGVEEGDIAHVAADGRIRRRVSGAWQIDYTYPRTYADDAARLARTGFTPESGEAFRVKGGQLYAADDTTPADPNLDELQGGTTPVNEPTYIGSIADVPTLTAITAGSTYASRTVLVGDWADIGSQRYGLTPTGWEASGKPPLTLVRDAATTVDTEAVSEKAIRDTIDAFPPRSNTLPDATAFRLHLLVGHATLPDAEYWSDGTQWIEN